MRVGPDPNEVPPERPIRGEFLPPIESLTIKKWSYSKSRGREEGEQSGYVCVQGITPLQ
jgi:hypothetical protein